MAEQRLIDANALLDKQESLYMKGHVLFHGVTAYAIENAPTIDPESLPIVQQLRAELARVTAERDAAVKDLQGCAIESFAECMYCRYKTARSFCWDCTDGSNWAYLGPQKEE